MNIIKENGVPFLFVLLFLGIFLGVYYYIQADIAVFRPDRYHGYSSIKGRVEGEENVVETENITLDEYYVMPELNSQPPELPGDNLKFGENKELLRWLELDNK